MCKGTVDLSLGLCLCLCALLTVPLGCHSWSGGSTGVCRGHDNRKLNIQHLHCACSTQSESQAGSTAKSMIPTLITQLCEESKYCALTTWHLIHKTGFNINNSGRCELSISILFSINFVLRAQASLWTKKKKNLCLPVAITTAKLMWDQMYQSETSNYKMT